MVKSNRVPRVGIYSCYNVRSKPESAYYLGADLVREGSYCLTCPLADFTARKIASVLVLVLTESLSKS